ncbi:MAG: YdcF family protein [Deltaproteobacteria bacterium]|nr:YdcF family protein [Deltaproteobacteria bacterium]
MGDMNFRLWFWSLFCGVAAIFLVAQSRTIWLPWIAKNLIVEDALRPADLIVVFAGSHEERASHAARLFHQGLAPRILVTGELTSKVIELFYHQRVTGAELSAKVLTDTRVPKSAVVVIPKGTSTYEEGEAIKQFMETHGYRSVIAVSSPYHMRRVRATLKRLLQGKQIEVRYSPEKGSGVEVKNWWKMEKDLVEVTNEYLKLAYYHLALF